MIDDGQLAKWALCPTVFAPVTRRHNKQSPKTKALLAKLIVKKALKSLTPEQLVGFKSSYPDFKP